MVAQPVEPESGGQEPTANLAGIPYEHEWIAASRLEVDPSYQYVVNPRWVKQIAAEFDPFLLDDLLVNRASDGRLLVMDGKHRLYAVRDMGYGDQNLPCKVYDNLPLALQAKRFNVQASRRRLRPTEQFNAGLIAGDPVARLVATAIERNGFRVNLHNGDRDNGQIVGVAAIVRIAKRGRPSDVDEVLALIRDGFGTDEGPRHTLIDGVWVFHKRFRGAYDRKRLVEVMRRMSQGKLVAEAGDVKRVLGLRMSDGVAFNLWKAYNHRLLDNHRLPDFSSADGRQPPASEARR